MCDIGVNLSLRVLTTAGLPWQVGRRPGLAAWEVTVFVRKFVLVVITLLLTPALRLPARLPARRPEHDAGSAGPVQEQPERAHLETGSKRARAGGAGGICTA